MAFGSPAIKGLCRRLCLILAVFLGGSSLVSLVWGEDIQFLQIGTGAIGGTNFAIGGMLASIISGPPGSRSCDSGGSCGVPGLIAVAQSSGGAVENSQAVAGGRLDTALVQADVVYGAYHGSGLFRDQGALRDLRVIANLFPTVMHIVVRADSPLHSVADLAGRRISLGEPGSGTLLNAKTVLAAYGLGEKDFDPHYLKPGPASDHLLEGKIDAFFVVAGVPSAAVNNLARTARLRLLPIDGTIGEEIESFYPFFFPAVIRSGVYRNVGFTKTVKVSTQWITSTKVDEELIYAVTKSLWHEKNQSLLRDGHPEGEHIRLDTALEQVAIPLHPGAARFYEEMGITR